MIILDTNVISAFMKAEPDVAVVAWLDRQLAVKEKRPDLKPFTLGRSVAARSSRIGVKTPM